MGSFNVICSISNTTIEAGDKIVIIPILRSVETFIESECFPPIFATYDDRGMVDIDDFDDNFYERSPYRKEIFDILNHGEIFALGNNDAKFELAFIHRKVYETLASILSHENELETVTNKCYINEYVLLKLGFVKIGVALLTNKMYSDFLIIKENNRFYYYQNGTKIDNIFFASDLKQYLPELNYSVLDFHIAILRTKQAIEKYEKALTETDCNNTLCKWLYEDITWSLKDWYIKTQLEEIELLDISETLYESIIFAHNLRKFGIKLRASEYGGQFTNYSSALILNQTIAQVIERKLLDEFNFNVDIEE